MWPSHGLRGQTWLALEAGVCPSPPLTTPDPQPHHLGVGGLREGCAIACLALAWDQRKRHLGEVAGACGGRAESAVRGLTAASALWRSGTGRAQPGTREKEPAPRGPPPHLFLGTSHFADGKPLHPLPPFGLGLTAAEAGLQALGPQAAAAHGGGPQGAPPLELGQRLRLWRRLRLKVWLRLRLCCAR